MTDLTTLANVKQWLGVTVSTDDAFLGRLISFASVFVQNLLNRNILSTAYTETYDGNSGTALFLPNYPITAVSSLTIDGISIPAASSPLVSGYTFNSTRISLNGYRFNRGYNNVAISYTAGFASVPLDLEQAVIEIVGIKYREIKRIGEVSKSIAGEVVSFSQADIPPTAKTILQQFKRVIPV